MTAFFFVNPKSGAQNGAVLLTGGASSMTYEDLGKIYIVDVTNQKNKASMLDTLKDFQCIQCQITLCHSALTRFPLRGRRRR